MDVTKAVAAWESLWNEDDPDQSVWVARSLLTDDAEFVDPRNNTTGPDAIAAAIQAVRHRSPGMTFTLGPPDIHHHVVRVPWHTRTDTGDRHGIDILVLTPEGRIRQALGFTDPTP